MAENVMADYLWKLGATGKIFIASDADQDDKVTGQTSFAATTPTWLLSVPKGKTVIPIAINLVQAGTVGGGAVDVIIEVDRASTRYGSSGTSEKVFNPNAGYPNAAASAVYSNPTALAGYGAGVWRATLGQDVSPAEGAVNGVFWKPEAPYFLVGPSALLVYTYAGVTGPTWFWGMTFAEIDTDEAMRMFA